MTDSQTLPTAFVWRRTHSLMGVWMVLFLIFHLLTNSQAALFVGDDGEGFIASVQDIHKLPYLPVIETIFLAIPFAIHMFWGVKYLFTSEPNSWSTNGSKPALGEYSRNQAFTWMRLTSWLLLFAILLHVLHMRFLEAPWEAEVGGQRYYMTRITFDAGLYTLASRLDVDIYDRSRIAELQPAVSNPSHAPESHFSPSELLFGPPEETYDPSKAALVQEQQQSKQRGRWVEALSRKPIVDGEVIAVAKDFGTATLLMVRDAFKKPWLVTLYAIFVLAACFHAFNGLWTAMIKWGITLTARSQRLWLVITTVLMILVAFLGLASVIGTYWINLRL